MNFGVVCLELLEVLAPRLSEVTIAAAKDWKEAHIEVFNLSKGIGWKVLNFGSFTILGSEGFFIRYVCQGDEALVGRVVWNELHHLAFVR